MSQYDGILSTVGTMAENKNDMGTLLRILATDEDYGPGVKFPLETFVYWLIPNLRYAALALRLRSLVLNPVVPSLWHTIVDIQHNIFLMSDIEMCFGFGSWSVDVCIFSTKGKNPNMVYSIVGNDNFLLNDGYLFMTTQAADGIYPLEVRSNSK